MYRRVAQVAPVAVLMAIGTPPYSADAAGVPSPRADGATVLIRERDRWRGDWGSRGWRFRDDDGWRFRRDDGWRYRDDDRWRFRGDHGWRGFRHDDGDWRRFRRHPGLDHFGPFFGIGRHYFFGPRHFDFDDGYGRRRKAPWW
jgi:hypothetical protein